MENNKYKMRILHTEWSDGLGGQEKRVLAEAAGLTEKGHYIALACRNHARIKNEAIKLGIDIHIFPYQIAIVQAGNPFLPYPLFLISYTY